MQRNMILLEARLSNVFKKLKPYMLENDDKKPTYFISFQDVLKIGMNPSSQNIGLRWAEPYGFYATPLKYWDNIYEMLTDEDIQFAHRKYLFLITFKPGSKVLYLDEFSQPIEAWEKIIERARKKYLKTKKPNIALTKYLSIALTKYLIDDMGLDVVIDNVGNIISPIESFEAVFLKPSAVKVIDVYELDPTEIEVLTSVYKDESGSATDLLYYLSKEDYKKAQMFAEALYGKEIALTILKIINSFMKDWRKFYPDWIDSKDDFIEYLLYKITKDENFEDYDEDSLQTTLEEEYDELKETGNKRKLEEFRKFIEKYDLNNIFELKD